MNYTIICKKRLIDIKRKMKEYTNTEKYLGVITTIRERILDKWSPSRNGLIESLVHAILNIELSNCQGGIQLLKI